MKVLVLFGGVSTEHMVSCRSAVNIIRGLRDAGHEVLRVGITEHNEWLRFLPPDEAIAAPDWERLAREALAAAPPAPPVPETEGEGLEHGANSLRRFVLGHAGGAVDVVFPAVHGINCEDGALQGLLQLTGLPYVGSEILASALAMDKQLTKQVCAAAGIPVCPGERVTRHMLESEGAEAVAARLVAALGLPLFVKPVNGGSSVGTMAADDAGKLAEALQHAALYDRQILVEERISGREIEVAVLGNGPYEAARAGEIIMADDVAYYDYQTKYFSGSAQSEAEVPARLDAAVEARVRDYAVTACEALGIAGLARVDFFYDEGSGRVLLNEINNLPGFTAISLYPQAFAHAGIGLAELTDRLCALALEAHGSRRRHARPELGEAENDA